MTVAEVRQKWNRRYQGKAREGLAPEPNPLALRFVHLLDGGTALDAACGLGAGSAAVIGRVERIVAVDLSETALYAAKSLWEAHGKVSWVQADVAAIPWPRDYFALVCAFGFTDWRFLRQAPTMVRPGGIFLYQGFSRRQLAVKPGLDPEWTSTPAAIAALFPGWRVLACEESDFPPFRVSFAGLRPDSDHEGVA